MVSLKSYSLKTNQGPYLQLNEDDVHVDLLNKLYLIFDGFGGSGLGDHAVRVAKETLSDFYNSFSEDHDKTLPFFYNPRFLLEGNALINAFRLAHQKIHENNLSKKESLYGGSSSIAMLQKENLLFCVSSGNCMGVKISRAKAEEVIPPDCFRYFKKDKEDLPFFTAPKSGLGLFPELDFRVHEIKVFEGDQFLLLTDGVYSKVGMDEIVYTLSKQDLAWSEKIDELFKMANDRGNVDNQSGILLNF